MWEENLKRDRYKVTEIIVQLFFLCYQGKSVRACAYMSYI